MAIHDALNVIAPSILKLGAAIKKLQIGKYRRAVFRSECVQAYNKSYEPPLLDCETRWSSCLFMLQAAVKLHKALVNTMAHRHLIGMFVEITLDETEWQHVIDMIGFPKIPEQINKELGGSLAPTIVMATQKYEMMVRHAAEQSLSQNPMLQAAGKPLQDKLKVKNVHLLTVPGRVSSFLDLRIARETKVESVLSLKILMTSVMDEYVQIQEIPTPIINHIVDKPTEFSIFDDYGEDVSSEHILNASTELDQQ